jgi:hypothetical protein
MSVGRQECVLNCILGVRMVSKPPHGDSMQGLPLFDEDGSQFFNSVMMMGEHFLCRI